MPEAVIETMEAVEGRVVWFADEPITFESFIASSSDVNVELIDGVMVERMSAQLEHEKLYLWLVTVLNLYVKNTNAGIVLGSRTAVEISQFGGRIPDILFVRESRLDIVRSKAVYGAPDLVIEITSPNDRPSDVVSLETDYRSIGVEEIVFIDPLKRRVHVRVRDGDDYKSQELTNGTLTFSVVPGFWIQVEWLFADPRPNELTVVTDLLKARPL